MKKKLVCLLGLHIFLFSVSFGVAFAENNPEDFAKFEVLAESKIKNSILNDSEKDLNFKKIVLIINQVRGTECCDEGSIEFFKNQIEALNSNGLKGNFAVRYDVLQDNQYVKILTMLDKTRFEVGAFLEITPGLAKDAGVEYHGNEKDWYKAENVYTIGYQFEDRIKIINTYMEKFYSEFGVYPKFSTAWIMDTNSINYLNEEYGVVTHQITREQWGTDSYTLSGGPVHYPYFANKNWAFVSADSDLINAQNFENTLIIRQTGSDPLFNYGDDTNSYTTQPNDYAIGNRGFEYFKKLKKQFFDQRQNSYGLLVLGLENSMTENFQVEFAKQLESIKEDSEVESQTVSEFNYLSKLYTQSVTGVQGADFINNRELKSFWVNSQKYRARFLYKNNSLYLTDLRIFNNNLIDPYNNYRAKSLGYWITPFIFNASQIYSNKNTTDEKTVFDVRNSKDFKEQFLTFLRKKYLPEFQKSNFEIKSSNNDSSVVFDGIQISEEMIREPEFKRDDNKNLQLIWSDKSNNQQSITFYQEKFLTNFQVSLNNVHLEKSDFIKSTKNWNGFSLEFNNAELNENIFSLQLNCKNEDCEFIFSQPSDEAFLQIREDLYPYFFPEQRERVVDNLNSVFYAHNKYAVAGKNPVRFVFIPKDDKGFATNYVGEPEIYIDPEVEEINLHDKQGNGTTFLDLQETKTGRYKVKFKLGDTINKNEIVYFAPDCKSKLAYCLIHPVELSWYLSSMFYTKLRNF